VFGVSPSTLTTSLASRPPWTIVQSPPPPRILPVELSDAFSTCAQAGMGPSEASNKARKATAFLRFMSSSPFDGASAVAFCMRVITPRGVSPQDATS